MGIEDSIVRHYAGGKRYDDMHVGGRGATAYLFGHMAWRAGMAVLDIGSGLGGPARLAAEQYGVRVTGIDLTPDFCEAAAGLAAEAGLADKVSFHAGSALDMPFADGAFDAAYTIHTAMNIADKAALYREARRVLKPGALFGIYDILGASGQELHFPVPWSAGPETSFLVPPEEMEALLREAGFAVERSESRIEEAKSLEGGRSAPIVNLLRNIGEGRCAPWLMICRAV